jgi:hypothetical protein
MNELDCRPIRSVYPYHSGGERSSVSRGGGSSEDREKPPGQPSPQGSKRQRRRLRTVRQTKAASSFLLPRSVVIRIVGRSHKSSSCGVAEWPRITMLRTRLAKYVLPCRKSQGSALRRSVKNPGRCARRGRAFEFGSASGPIAPQFVLVATRESTLFWCGIPAVFSKRARC